MASVREQVLDAVLAMVKAALPDAEVRRNNRKAQGVGPGGSVIIHDGQPGDPDVTLCPLSYTYDHAVELDIAVHESVTDGREARLDEMMSAIGDAIAADRTLGGLCEWVEAHAPAPEDIEIAGAEPLRWAELTLTCVYTTTNPLA